MKVALDILPFGDDGNSLLSLDFNHLGPVGMVSFTDTGSDGRLAVDLCELSQIIKTCSKHLFFRSISNP